MEGKELLVIHSGEKKYNTTGSYLYKKSLHLWREKKITKAYKLHLFKICNSLHWFKKPKSKHFTKFLTFWFEKRFSKHHLPLLSKRLFYSNLHAAELIMTRGSF